MGVCYDKPCNCLDKTGACCSEKQGTKVVVMEECIDSEDMPAPDDNLVLQDTLPTKNEFAVLLEKTGDTPLGLDLDVVDGRTAWVIGIKDGVAVAYNDDAPEDMQLKVGDFITEVNGIRDNSKAMLACLKHDRDLTLQVRRPQTFDIQISRHDKPLGFDFTLDPVGRSILIENIKEGCIRTWNKENPFMIVKAKDRVFAVDGEMSSAAGLVDQIKNAGEELELSIVRPEEDPEAPPRKSAVGNSDVRNSSVRNSNVRNSNVKNVSVMNAKV